MQNLTETDQYEIFSDGRTVWINLADGTCIGRFSPGGVDIHLDWQDQMANGKECLDCFARTGSLDMDWSKFSVGMMHHYGIEVPDIHRPKGAAPWIPINNYS